MASLTRTLVFVPLREEMKYIDSIMSERGASHGGGAFDERDDEHSYVYYRLNGFLTSLTFRVLADMGNLRTAVAVAARYIAVQPELILLMGLAGSLDVTKARLGDVFVIDVAKALYPDKMKAIDPEKEVPLSRHIDGDDRVVIDDRKLTMNGSYMRFRRDMARGTDTNLHVGAYVGTLPARKPLPLAVVDDSHLGDGMGEDERERCRNVRPKVEAAVVLGSDMVVDSQAYIDFLQQRNLDENEGVYASAGKTEYDERNVWRKGEIPIVDMESYGFFKLAETFRANGIALRAFAVRGISDLAAGKGHLDGGSKKAIRAIAARNATTVLMDFLEQLDRADPSTR